MNRTEENERIRELTETIAKIARPLEVLRALDDDWRHPRLRKWWHKLVSKDLREDIIRATDLARKTLGS